MTAGVLTPEPLLLKELSGYSRRWQTYFVRVIYVGLIALIVARFWISTSAIANLSVSEFAQLGRDLFLRFIILQMSFVTLAAIAQASNMVVKEGRAGTLDLLILAPITIRSIAWAKWKAAMIQSGTLLLCGVPVLAICVYLGGVGLWDLAWSFFLTLGSAALGASFSIRYSAIYPTAAKTIVMSILALVGYTLLPVAVGLTGVWPILLVAVFTHPIYAAVGANLARFGASGFTDVMSYGWITATISSFLVSWFLLRSAAFHILRRCQSPPRAERIPVPSRTVARMRAVSGPVRGTVWDDRPLLWKELATRAGARMRNDLLIGLYCLFAFIILLCWLITRGMHLSTMAFVVILFMLLAVGAGAALFAPEKEARRWDMLLSTPVTSWQIIWNKLIVNLIAPEGLAVLALYAISLLAWGWWAGPAGLLAIFVVYGLAFILAYVLAATASLFAKTVAGAFTLACCLLGLILLVIPALLSGFIPGAQPDQFPQVLSTVTNPIGVLDAAFIGPEEGLDPWNGQHAGLVMIFSGIYMTAIAGLVGWMTCRFNHAVGRV